MLSGVLDRVLALHGWIALAIVFLLPALEASAFVGFVFPGEIAVLLGGVLAYQHRVSLAAAIGAAVLGAVIGDSLPRDSSGQPGTAGDRAIRLERSGRSGRA